MQSELLYTETLLRTLRDTGFTSNDVYDLWFSILTLRDYLTPYEITDEMLAIRRRLGVEHGERQPPN
jgi:hypothetical protein